MIAWLAGAPRTARVFLAGLVVAAFGLSLGTTVLAEVNRRERAADARRAREATCQAIRGSAGLQALALVDTIDKAAREAGRPETDPAIVQDFVRRSVSAIDCALILRGELPQRLRDVLNQPPARPTP